MKRPDFFIVGAPKCGTTALYNYLRQHPQIFMPFHKEPLYFGSDLTTRYGRMTAAQYLNLFRHADPSQRVGEASAWYLYSELAAGEIHAFSPHAQIIAMVRNPVDVMYAQHSQLLFNKQEDLADFADALDAESDRKSGKRIPPGAVRVENLFYRDIVKFSRQLQRYMDVFGRDRVHVIVLDDLKVMPDAVYRGVLDFLAVDPMFKPSFTPANENKSARSEWLQRLVYQPPPLFRQAIPVLRQLEVVHRIRGAILSWNSQTHTRNPMDFGLRERLTVEMAGEVESLSHLLGRDLSKWANVRRTDASPRA